VEKKNLQENAARDSEKYQEKKQQQGIEDQLREISTMGEKVTCVK
jgi:hypothetical protein